MDLVRKAFSDLYPGKVLSRDISVNFSGRFKSFNANVHYSRNFLNFNLSKNWRSVSDEIKIGLFQSLLMKVFQKVPPTENIVLYESFIKHLSTYAPKIQFDPWLEISFNRVNEKYFGGLLDLPNLKWGRSAVSKLGSYEYQSDTVTVSSIFQNAPEYLLDFIMFHELLHKKFKFKSKNGRSFHHTRKFKDAEKQFENYFVVERELTRFCRKSRIKRVFSWF